MDGLDSGSSSANTLIGYVYDLTTSSFLGSASWSGTDGNYSCHTF